jgi:hypothetical protein
MDPVESFKALLTETIEAREKNSERVFKINVFIIVKKI